MFDLNNVELLLEPIAIKQQGGKYLVFNFTICVQIRFSIHCQFWGNETNSIIKRSHVSDPKIHLRFHVSFGGRFMLFKENLLPTKDFLSERRV